MTSEITGFQLGINGMSNDTIMLPCNLYIGKCICFVLLFCIVVLIFVTEYLMEHEILLFTARMGVQSHVLIHLKILCRMAVQLTAHATYDVTI